MALSGDGWRRARLLVPEFCGSGAKKKLDALQVNYLTAVLRLGCGDEVFAFDGRGNERRCVLEREKRNWILKDCGASEHAPTDAALVIHVGQGSAPRNRLDWAVEKMTEAGAASITALASYGTSRKDWAGASAARWRRIAAAAAAQCGRFCVPVMRDPVDMEDWSALLPRECPRLLLSLADAPLLSEVAQEIVACKVVAVAIGRKAGIDAREEWSARASGFMPVSLGKRVLRTETAGVVALSVLLAAASEL